MDTWNAIWANELYQKLIYSVLLLLAQTVIRHLFVNYIINRIPNGNPKLYSIRKVANYVISVGTIFLLITIWVQRLGDLSVALGILAAGLAFSLQEVIGSFAGWVMIISVKPFTVGDRIETSNIRGDVVDISILRTTVMEIGNWLNGDHNTGRIVTISNAQLLKEPLYNYTAHLNFVWDEIEIPITYESNYEKAIEIMVNAVYKHPAYQELLPQAREQRREVRRTLAVRMTPLEPRSYVKLTDNWIELGLVYPVDTDLRRLFRSEISQRVLTEFKSEDIVVASQTIAIVQFPSASEAKQ